MNSAIVQHHQKPVQESQVMNSHGRHLEPLASTIRNICWPLGLTHRSCSQCQRSWLICRRFCCAWMYTQAAKHTVIWTFLFLVKYALFQNASKIQIVSEVYLPWRRQFQLKLHDECFNSLLNKERPTWCHFFYYYFIQCSTCFGC